MARSSTGARAAWSRRPRHIAAAIMALATTAGLGIASGRPALASPGSAAPAPVVTRAALDPSLVAGRGADLGFAEQEAENAATNGTVIGPVHRGLHAGGRGFRAVGGQPGARAVRRVHAAGRGQRDQCALQHPRRAHRRRDHRAARCHGERRPPPDHDAHVAVRLALQRVPVLQRPERRSAAPGLVDTECTCVPDATTPAPVFPTPFRPNHFYDEQRLLLGRTYPAGATVRLTAPAGSAAATTTIDLMDSQLVAPPKFDAAWPRTCSVRRRPDRPPRLRRRVRPGDRVRAAHPPHGLHPAGPVTR